MFIIYQLEFGGYLLLISEGSFAVSLSTLDLMSKMFVILYEYSARAAHVDKK